MKKIQVIEATSPSIIPGSVFEVRGEMLPGAEISIVTPAGNYVFDIDRVDKIENEIYRASNSNNIVIFKVVTNG